MKLFMIWGYNMSKQTDSAYQYIKQRILDGSYKPAQKLNEIELAEAIGVSRNTVKKALLNLQQENLVEIEDNRGAFVKSYTLDEVKNYLEIREVLEGLVARKAARNISDTEINQLKEILERMSLCIRDNRLDEYSDCNHEFHKVIYNTSKNEEAVELITIIRTQLIRYHFRTILVPGRNQESYKDHQRIFEALKARDENQAEEAIRNHIANVRETIEKNYNYLI
jgi:DNA-binding GntR family transcriptional regulator